MHLLLAISAVPPEDMVNLDDGQLEGGIPQGLQKVELDLDDAPFLDVEEDDVHSTAEAEQEASRKKKASPSTTGLAGEERKGFPLWLWIVLGAGLLVAGGLIWFLLSSAEPEEKPVPPPAKPRKKQKRVEIVHTFLPSKHPSSPLPMMTFQPFVLEQNTGGTTRFLLIKFSVRPENMDVGVEIQSRRHVLRNAIFASLRTNPLPAKERPESAEIVEQRLKTVLDKILRKGRIEQVLLEQWEIQ